MMDYCSWKKVGKTSWMMNERKRKTVRVTQDYGITVVWSICKDAVSYSEVFILFGERDRLGLIFQVSHI